jgi:hypothetical protein
MGLSCLKAGIIPEYTIKSADFWLEVQTGSGSYIDVIYSNYLTGPIEWAAGKNLQDGAGPGWAGRQCLAGS